MHSHGQVFSDLVVKRNKIKEVSIEIGDHKCLGLTIVNSIQKLVTLPSLLFIFLNEVINIEF